MKNLFNYLTNDTVLCSLLVSVKITLASVAELQKKITKAKVLRAVWNIVHGQPEDVTVVKDKVLVKMGDWMDSCSELPRLLLKRIHNILKRWGLSSNAITN